MKSDSYFDLLLRRWSGTAPDIRPIAPGTASVRCTILAEHGQREGLLVPNRGIGKQSAQESRIANIEKMPAQAWMKPLIIQINPRPYALAAAIAFFALGGTHSSGGETSVAPAEMRRIGTIDERFLT